MALTARSRGSSETSIFSKSITTEVSTSPRGGRVVSGTRRRVLRRDAIELIAKTLGVDARSATENGDGRFGADKPMATKRGQLSHWNTVASDHEGLAFVELAHDLTALIAKLSLGDLAAHRNIVARRATAGRSLDHESRKGGAMPKRLSRAWSGTRWWC